MRDLVETAIAQVVQRDNSHTAAKRSNPHHASIHSAAPASRTAPPAEGSRDEKLWQVSLKFEAMFMQQMMASMRKSVPESGFLPHGFAEKSYESMMDQAIADSGSKQGALGIASAVYQQLNQHGVTHQEAVQAVGEASDKLRMAAIDRYKAIGAVK
ncbi:MAG: rod-binding protein [Mariprofundales bacterium]